MKEAISKACELKYYFCFADVCSVPVVRLAGHSSMAAVTMPLVWPLRSHTSSMLLLLLTLSILFQISR
jgi:hypothetical protein